MQSRWARALAATVLAGVTMTVSAQGKWPAITDQPTAKQVPGRWIWAELVTSDVDAARAFYSKVFGWKFEPAATGEGGETYWRASVNGRPIAGVMKSRSSAANRAAQWIGVASSEDPQATSARVTGAGGKVVVPPRKLEGRGEVAMFSDPNGAHFAVIRADRGDPIERAPAAGEWLWIELWANDPEREAAFYQKVFGYSVEPSDARGAQRSYLLSAGGKARAGVLRKLDSQLPTEWVPYLRVDNVDRTVEQALAAGARLIVAPTPHHRSRVAVLVDPGGAPFAVAEWRPQ